MPIFRKPDIWCFWSLNICASMDCWLYILES